MQIRKRVQQDTTFALFLMLVLGIGSALFPARQAQAQTLQSVTVTAPAGSTTPPSVAMGSALQLTATANFSNGTKQNVTATATWTTASASKDTVAAGLMTGVSTGTTTVTASYTFSGVTKKGNISVYITIPATFFAMDINVNNTPPNGQQAQCPAYDGSYNDPWPSQVGAPFSTYRTLGGGVLWSSIETGQNSYNWGNLSQGFDSWIYQMKACGQEAMVTAYWTPSWAVPNPNDTCGGTTADPGCELPSDVLTGDVYWTDFLTNLIQHVDSTFGPGTLRYLEIWNEPNINSECNQNANCSPAALVQMTKDAQTVLKNLNHTDIKIISPAVTGAQPQPPVEIAPFLGTMLADGIGNYADIIGFHGYLDLGVYPPNGTVQPGLATNISTLIASTNAQAEGVQGLLKQYGVTKPIFNTEGSWSIPYEIPITNAAGEREFTGIYYLVQAGYTTCPTTTACSNLIGFSWYGWDYTNTGQYWNKTTEALTPAGTAYHNVYSWLNGAAPIGVCTAASSVWTCNYQRPSGYIAQAVWNVNTKSVCGSNTSCPYTFPSGMVQYLDLSGGVHTIPHGATTVQVGLEPILLENMNIP